MMVSETNGLQPHLISTDHVECSICHICYIANPSLILDEQKKIQ